MTRRQRLENKLLRRQDWSEKAATRSAAAFKRADDIAQAIPLGQPVLLGHHSEAHARRDAERISTNMHKGVEESNLAAHHGEKASGLARQLDHSIFSDDADAIAELEARIAEREQKAAQHVALNASWRKSKGDVTAFAKIAGISEAAAQQIANSIATVYNWEKQPIPAWELSNLRANIRRDKERIKEIKARQAQQEKAEAAGGITIEGDAWVRVTFAEKPAYHILASLRAAGFAWSGGSWVGQREKLPAAALPGAGS